MNSNFTNRYKNMGICDKVAVFGETIVQQLQERFEQIDENAQIIQ